jgi:[lysine-biosynthesis-protein LysW]--L-2-aminoadipate ligase
MSRILLSVTALRPDERRLFRALESEGLRVEIALANDTSEYLNRAKVPPELVLVRNLSHSEASAIAHLFELAGIETLNRAGAIDVCINKARQALLFREHEIPHPESSIAFTFDQVQDAFSALGGNVVIKPVDGSWGRGIVHVASQESLECWKGGRELFTSSQKAPVLVQRFVSKPGHDIRVVIVGHHPVVAFRRVFGHWRTNTHLGASVEPISLSSTVRELSAHVVELLGPGFFGLDLLEDAETGELLVCEINHNPEFARSSVIHGVDVARALASLIAHGLTQIAPGVCS